MGRFILGVIVAFGALVFISTPGGKATVAAVSAKLQAVTQAVPVPALPTLDEAELSAPPIPEAPESAAAQSAPAAPQAQPATGPDDTFAAVMEVYERGAQEQGATKTR